MAYKAHRHLLNYCGRDADKDDIARAIGQTTAYNTVVGNSYTASMYLGLAALLDQADDLSGRPVGFLSYGSGSVAEFFAGTVVAGYQEHLRTKAHLEAIDRRRPVDYAGYRALHERAFPTDGGDHSTPAQTTGPFRLAGISGHKRIYQAR
jgi:hydroxymethylglutaryl-CoA synthase